MWIILRYLLVGIGSIGLWTWLRARQPRPIAQNPDDYISYPNTLIETVRHEDDALTINWQYSSQQTSIWYSDNAHFDTNSTPSNQPLVVTGNITEVVVSSLPVNKRHYIQIAFDDGKTYQLAERDIPTPHIKNLRDIGGYRTHDGRMTRWNTLFRGASLKDATEVDHAILQELGIQLICDLRSDEEVADAPNQLPANIAYKHLATSTHENRFAQLLRIITEPDYFDKVLFELYTRVIIDQNSPLFGTIFKHIVTNDLPLLIHCAAGKDRTGITIALLLRILGVPDATIQADYSLSNLHFDYFVEISASLLEQLSRVRITTNDVTPIFSANPITIQKLLDYVDEKYGSVEAYLLQTTALTNDDFDQIRQRLLVNQP